MAQAVPEASTPDQPAVPVAEEIVVTGLRAGIERSLDVKRDAVSVIDVITAEDIGKFPDNNLAESLQRIPGITIDRSELGEGRTINLRGLGGGFTRSEINGGSAINGFDFVVLAPELFSRLTVEKSPTASSVEGGLAGTVKSETVKPFDIQGLRIAATAGVTLGQAAKATPRVFGLVSKNWDDRFGVTLAVAYSKTDFRTNEIAYGPWVRFRDIASPAALATGPAALLDAATPRTSAYYSYIEKRDNLGGTLAVQARPSDKLDITLDGIFGQADGARNDDRPDIPIEGNNDLPTNYTITDGAVTSATFGNVQNRVGSSYRPQKNTVYQGTLRAEWRPTDRLTITPGLTYARQKVRSELQLASFAINGTTVSYAVDGKVPNFSSTATDFISNPQDFGYNVLIFDRLDQITEEYLAKVDAKYNLDDSGDNNIEFGVRYTDRSTDRIGINAGLFSGADLLGPTPPGLGAVFTTRKFKVRGAPSQTPSRVLAADPTKVAETYYPGLDPFSSPEFYNDPVQNSLRTFDVGEKTLGGYVQGNFAIGDLRINAGVRVVQTKTNSNGTQLVDGAPSARSDSGKYTNFLPAINARYEIKDNLFARATYSRSMTRPDLDSLTPTQIVNSGPRTGTRGNPDLRPFAADQGDLGLEYYFGRAALVTATGFVKQIDSLISQTVVRENATFPDQITGVTTEGIVAFTQPANGDRATVKGLELGLQSPFSFLPGVLSSFGAILNYTYATSKATIREASGSTRSTALPGLSKHSANAVLYFDREGIDARLAYAYRSAYLRDDAVGRQFGAERNIRSYGQLDFSLNVPVNSVVAVGVDVTNILDRQRSEFIRIDTGAELPANVIELERRFTLTARAVF